MPEPGDNIDPVSQLYADLERLENYEAGAGDTPPTPDPADAETVDQLNKTWEGRLKAAQKEKDQLEAQLAERERQINLAYSYAQSPYQQAPTEQNTIEAFDADPITYIQRVSQAEAQRQVQGVAEPLNPILNLLMQTAVSQAIPDYTDLKPEIDAQLKRWGFRDMTHAMSSTPQDPMQLVRDAANCIRGARGTSSPPLPPVPPPERVDPAVAEAERRAGIAAASVTGSGGAAPRASGAKYPASLTKAAEAYGMTVEELLTLDEGPVKIRSGKRVA